MWHYRHQSPTLVSPMHDPKGLENCIREIKVTFPFMHDDCTQDTGLMSGVRRPLSGVQCCLKSSWAGGPDWRPSVHPVHSDASFATIKQGATEPYIKFLAQLHNVLDCQVENPATQESLLRQLAIKNANADCRKIWGSIKAANPTIADMIKAWQDGGTESHKMSLLADALTSYTRVGVTQKANCLNFGESLWKESA